ncbi:MAG: hypothetical protein U0W40_13215 [Acidimicrobiia bacterium]
MSDAEYEIVTELDAYRRVIARLLAGPHADEVRSALRDEGLPER